MEKGVSVSPRLARVSYVLCSILLAACIIIAQLTVPKQHGKVEDVKVCLLYTSDAADE